MVPRLMTALVGTTQEGKRSARAIGNTGDFGFQVVEFDRGTCEAQARGSISISNATVCHWRWWFSAEANPSMPGSVSTR